MNNTSIFKFIKKEFANLFCHKSFYITCLFLFIFSFFIIFSFNNSGIKAFKIADNYSITTLAAAITNGNLIPLMLTIIVANFVGSEYKNGYIKSLYNIKGYPIKSIIAKLCVLLFINIIILLIPFLSTTITSLFINFAIDANFSEYFRYIVVLFVIGCGFSSVILSLSYIFQNPSKVITIGLIYTILLAGTLNILLKTYFDADIMRYTTLLSYVRTTIHSSNHTLMVSAITGIVIYFLNVLFTIIYAKKRKAIIRK